MNAGFEMRMTQEYTDLSNKIGKLEVTLANPPSTIAREQLSLMNEQLSAMRRYSEVLLQRIKLLSVEKGEY